MDSPSRIQTNPSSILRGKVRVVARIRGCNDQELGSDDGCSSFMTYVHKAGDGESFDKVTLSFDNLTSSCKHEYDVDHCYYPNEDTALIFSKEIRPQIARIFLGEHSTFIAYGARGGGKTHTVQGSEDNIGLGTLALDEILKTVGGKHAVAVSIYEVFHTHVYDVLDSKNSEVQVLNSGQGKIMLKGLSKVRVESVLEFQKLCSSRGASNNSTQKITRESPQRSHKALMIHVLACNEGGTSECIGKVNFVDLAGYESTRSNSIVGPEFIESIQINRSLNALLNVIHALNANETRVPYRESKLARTLQDSLCGNSHVSLIVCLKPIFCQDTIQTMTLASGLKSIKPKSVLSSSAKKYSNSSVWAEKRSNSRLPLSAKKINVVLEGRLLDPEPKSPVIINELEPSNCQSGTFSMHNSRMKRSLIQDYLEFLNSATKDDLKRLPGIGEKRASYIIELRENSPEPFKSLDDLKEIGVSTKQANTMMKKAAAHLFD